AARLGSPPAGGGDVRTQQPRPYRSLVVRSVPGPLVAAVRAAIRRIERRQCSQSYRRQQLAGDATQQPERLGTFQDRKRQRDGENLIGPHAFVGARLPWGARAAVKP